jgi:4-diphosphocytidyl-2-C-methyl-D-erythritol kinase
VTAVEAPAKINLWLRVGDLRADGFHEIDTLFCALELADTVQLERTASGGIGLHVEFAPPLVTLPDTGSPEANLAVRAARAFSRELGLETGLGIRLVKRIPAGGGLGGGSSDAAAVFRGLARLHPGGLGPETLHRLATGLGSDVPFFTSGAPVARGRGRGELLENVTPLPSRPVLLVLPHVHVATATAYRWLDEDRAAGTAPPSVDPIQLPRQVEWEWIEEMAHNDFEPVVSRRHQELGRLRDALSGMGARLALLAGSGSTVFGVFADDAPAVAAADELRKRFPRVTALLTRTRAR